MSDPQIFFAAWAFAMVAVAWDRYGFILRARVHRWARKRQSLYMAQESAKRASAEAWSASYRCYDICEPPAYIRKAEGCRWLGRFQE